MENAIVNSMIIDEIYLINRKNLLTNNNILDIFSIEKSLGLENTG